jgi:hypothetical protein
MDVVKGESVWRFILRLGACSQKTLHLVVGEIWQKLMIAMLYPTENT